MNKFSIFLLVTGLFTLTAFSQSPDILLNGTVSAQENQIKNVADPTDAQDAVTKNYVYSKAEVDSLIAQAVLNLQSQINNLASVSDVDGNSYNYLNYGDQVWTVENAEMVTYRDGTPIPQAADQQAWLTTTTGAWCYFDNDPTKGILYNWYAVAGIHDNDSNTPNKELAPEGWHVASYTEWEELQSFLIDAGYNFDETTEGNKIAKAMASATGWEEGGSSSSDGGELEIGDPGYDQITNNSSDFNAYPTGGRRYNGSSPPEGFFNEGIESGYWSSTESTEQDGRSWQFHFYIDGNNTRMYEWYKNQGWAVRFIKDSVTNPNDMGGDGNAAEIPSEGLVAYYPFNGNANDESSFDNHGTVNGATLTADRFGNDANAYSFDGIDNYINSDFLISGQNTMTFSFWSKTTQADNEMSVITQDCGSDCSDAFALVLNKFLNSAIECEFGHLESIQSFAYAQAAHYGTVNFENSNGGWKHYTIVTGTDNNFSYNNFKLYIDGVHYDTSCDHNWGGWEYNYPNYPLVIGKGNESILGSFFEGEIDDIAVWNRALSDEEIANLYDI